MNDKKICEIMEKLQLTRQEAIKLIEADKKIDSGEKLFELTEKQKQNSKQARQTTGQVEKKKREFVFYGEDVEKSAIIKKLNVFFSELGQSKIINRNRELALEIEGVQYKLVLTRTRVKKEEVIK